MKQIAAILACGAALLWGGVAASAAERSGDEQAKTDASQITEFSSQNRRHARSHRHWRHGHHYRPYRYGYYPRPYYRNYGYYPRHYYRGGPGITFSFGSGPRYW